MKKRPEYMILVAVIAALVVGILANAVCCSIVNGAVNDAVHNGAPGYNSIIEEIEGGNGGNLLDELLGDGNGNNDNGQQGNGEGNNGDNGQQGNSEGNGNGSTPGQGLIGGYTEEDVPATMEIETPELTDDLQACIAAELNRFVGSDTSVTVSDLTKDDVAKPELKDGRVLSQVSGKVTITMAEGKSETVDYTSYYYAEDPTAQKVVWYIYAYDLGSYDLFPDGFKDASGDPNGIRDIIQGNPSSLNELFGRNGQRESTNA